MKKKYCRQKQSHDDKDDIGVADVLTQQHRGNALCKLRNADGVYYWLPQQAFFHLCGNAKK